MDKKNFYSLNGRLPPNFKGDKVKITIDKITNNFVVLNYNETDKKNNCFKYWYRNEIINRPPNKRRYKIICKGFGYIEGIRYDFYTIKYSSISYKTEKIHLCVKNNSHNNDNIVGENN
jgi:hypothetical protein